MDTHKHDEESFRIPDRDRLETTENPETPDILGPTDESRTSFPGASLKRGKKVSKPTTTVLVEVTETATDVWKEGPEVGSREVVSTHPVEGSTTP